MVRVALIGDGHADLRPLEGVRAPRESRIPQLTASQPDAADGCV